VQVLTEMRMLQLAVQILKAELLVWGQEVEMLAPAQKAKMLVMAQLMTLIFGLSRNEDSQLQK